MKYLGIDLQKDVKAQYTENYKICCRKVKKVQKYGERYCAQGLEDSVMSKCQFSLN